VNITRTGADKCKQMGMRIDPMEFMDTLFGDLGLFLGVYIFVKYL